MMLAITRLLQYINKAIYWPLTAYINSSSPNNYSLVVYARLDQTVIWAEINSCCVMLTLRIVCNISAWK